MIKILNDRSPDLVKTSEIQALFGQLSPNKTQISIKDLLSDPANPIIFACFISKEKVIGIASMCIYKVISGHKGWIEDVVVDANHRGLGIGKKLIAKLIDQAKEKELDEVYLFTEDEKQAAIGLYTKLGFKQKNSILYNLKVNEKKA